MTVRLFIAALALAALGSAAQAQQAVAKTQQARIQEGSAIQSYSVLDQREQLLASIWGLNAEEMVRAKVLMEGPRKSFSVENLSPIEALGIHARNDAERRKYAEMFARALHADVERSLAWNSAFIEAMARMYPGEPVVNYTGLPKVNASIGAADALGVPRGLVTDPAASALPRATPQPAGGRRP
ncbi:hypothetical protein [Ottowia sp.]|uniref:hypothetical protein n=1 Tax=Ottowia sp. TaxID=1898956 RepID=UPI003A8BC0FE